MLTDLLKCHNFKEMTCLYTTSTDSFDVKTCHLLCQGYNNIVWIIHTIENNVFGAFTTTTWNTNNNVDIKDPNSFIFLLRSMDKTKELKKFDIVTLQNKATDAVRYHNNYLCLIGTGYDISIPAECDKPNQFTYCCRGNYKTPTKYYINNEKRNFIVKSIEIFHCE